jgi:hypothetical protein
MINSISVHGVVSVKVMPEYRKEGTIYQGMPPFYHRKIIITDRNGHEFELDLFGERERDLVVALDD